VRQALAGVVLGFAIVCAHAAEPMPAGSSKQVLLEACAAMKEPEKRASCFEAVARMEAPAAPAANKFANLKRAFTAISAATTTGVSLVQYAPMIQAAATEVALARDAAASDAERQALDLYERAIDAYRDAATFWQRDIEFYARSDNRLAYGGGLPVDMVGVGHLVGKWNLSAGRSDIWGINRGVPRSYALSTMWAAAGKAVEDGEIALGLRQPPAPEPVTGTPEHLVGVTRKAKAWITEGLPHPENARFRWLYLSRAQIPTVCGEIDPPDADGAATGFRRFIVEVVDGPAYVAIDPGEPGSSFAGIWPKSCGEKYADLE
jgi:hypothetical protein